MKENKITTKNNKRYDNEMKTKISRSKRRSCNK